MPDKRLGRPLCFPCRCLLGGQRLFARTWGGRPAALPGDGLAPRGGGGVWRPSGPPNQRAQGPKAPAPFVCASRTRRPPRGQANAALPVVGRIGFTKQNSEPHSVWLAGGLANGAHGGAEGHQRQLCQLKVLFPPGDADDGDAPQAAKHKGFDSQGQAADQQPDDVGQ